MQDYEKLGAFYMGRLYDQESRQTRDELLLYDSKDLTTHGVIVGMTGSGKTGLGVALLEEAAIDGIPAIAIDPKGDLGNLLLTFPKLSAEEFRPWIDEGEATRKGMNPDQYAAKVAKTWKEGLASWHQPPERIGLYEESAERVIYTPGSDSGRPLTVLQSLDPPPPEVREDLETFREQISATTSGLLALLGVKADPIQSREHILIANLIDHAWREGKSLDIPELIRGIQSPPFETVGVFDLDTFFPANDRTALAMRLNNLLASPTFAGWMQGEPLDIKSLLYTADGRPKLSIISISHLGDSERMFFVTILLNQLLAWVRTQAGTSSLRAMFYMDEIFGYFPPVAKPPSKGPMLTLLKQARAYGLGIVLSTQNPADLDYKGLSNTGTWFLGRLQTDRDKQRVLDGLEGASTQAGQAFDRKEMDSLLSGLNQRVFLMNNVHDDAPVLFQTRWVLSYLRGPLTRDQIRKLTPADESEPSPTEPREIHPRATSSEANNATDSKSRPLIPPTVDEIVLEAEKNPATHETRLYRPAVLGRLKLHFVYKTYGVDEWREDVWMALADEDLTNPPWESAQSYPPEAIAERREPEPDAEFESIPPELLKADNYKSWTKDLKDYAYDSIREVVWKCTELKTYSEAGESERDFRIRLTQAAREKRDLEVEKLRQKYASKLSTIEKRIDTAQRAVKRETEQYERARSSSVLSIGSTILGALFGRKLKSRTNVTKTTSSIRSVGRAADQRDDIAEAEAKVEELQTELKALQTESDDAIHKLQQEYDIHRLELERKEVKPRKYDIEIEQVAFAWVPWAIDNDNRARPLLAPRPKM